MASPDMVRANAQLARTLAQASGENAKDIEERLNKAIQSPQSSEPGLIEQGADWYKDNVLGPASDAIHYTADHLPYAPTQNMP